MSLKACDNSLPDLRRFLNESSQFFLQLLILTLVDICAIFVIVKKKVPIWLTEKLISLKFSFQTISIENIIDCLCDNIQIKEAAQNASYDLKDLHTLKPTAPVLKPPIRGTNLSFGY